MGLRPSATPPRTPQSPRVSGHRHAPLHTSDWQDLRGPTEKKAQQGDSSVLQCRAQLHWTPPPSPLMPGQTLPPYQVAFEAKWGRSVQDHPIQTHSHIHLSVCLSHTQIDTHPNAQCSHTDPEPPEPAPPQEVPNVGQEALVLSRASWLAGALPAPQAAILRGHTKRLYSGETEQQSTFSWLGR